MSPENQNNSYENINENKIRDAFTKLLNEIRDLNPSNEQKEALKVIVLRFNLISKYQDNEKIGKVLNDLTSETRQIKAELLKTDHLAKRQVIIEEGKSALDIIKSEFNDCHVLLENINKLDTFTPQELQDFKEKFHSNTTKEITDLLLLIPNGSHYIRLYIDKIGQFSLKYREDFMAILESDKYMHIFTKDESIWNYYKSKCNPDQVFQNRLSDKLNRAFYALYNTTGDLNSEGDNGDIPTFES